MRTDAYTKKTLDRQIRRKRIMRAEQSRAETEQSRAESRAEQKQSRQGFPSIDKPWLKYYNQEFQCGNLPECSLFKYLYENNQHNLDTTALNFLVIK